MENNIDLKEKAEDQEITSEETLDATVEADKEAKEKEAEATVEETVEETVENTEPAEEAAEEVMEEQNEDIPLTVAPVPKFKQPKEKKKAEKQVNEEPSDNKEFFKKLFKSEKSKKALDFFKSKTWDRIALGLLLLAIAIPLGLLVYVVVTYFL